MPSKERGVLSPTSACFAHVNHFFFFIYKKTIISLIPHNNYKKNDKKIQKIPFYFRGKKKLTPRVMG